MVSGLTDANKFKRFLMCQNFMLLKCQNISQLKDVYPARLCVAAVTMTLFHFPGIKEDLIK